MKAFALSSFVLLISLLVGYPAAACFEHGLLTSAWPGHSLTTWIWYIENGQLLPVVSTYASMFMGQATDFSGGGHYQAGVIFTPLTLVIFFLFVPKSGIQRASLAIFGSARWANAEELSQLHHGLELGRNPATGKVVRVTVQSSLISYAPPRTGKTSGLILPNLAYPVPNAWGGPAVVFDTKGEIYKASAERRKALGRKVVCLDPTGIVGGTDQYNPLAGTNADDVLYLQRTARALLPTGTSRDGNGKYFENRAVDYLVGAFIAALRTSNNATPQTVNALLNDREQLMEILRRRRKDNAARRALRIMEADEKTREPIESTAQQAFSWLSDERPQEMVGDNTFDLSQLAKGELDLFVTYPSEDSETLSPLLRWLLMDIFTLARREEFTDRVIVFADEAANIGKFDELLVAASELPGRGLSLWTFWQDRSQVSQLYGEEAAQTLANLAEIVTFSDLPASDPEQLEHVSRSLGDLTAYVTSESNDTQGKNSTTTRAMQAVPLLSPTDIKDLEARKLIVLSNAGTRSKHPMLLDKTVSYSDKRFKRFLRSIKPVA